MNFSSHRAARLLSKLILRAAAQWVSRAHRTEWLQEWDAELWHVLHMPAREPLRQLGSWPAIGFALGSFTDAFWMRRNSHPAPASRPATLHTPWRCLAFVAGLAAITAAISLTLPAPNTTGVTPTFSAYPLQHGALLLLALFLLATRSSLQIGVDAPSPHLLAARPLWRRSIFFMVKTALAVVAAYWGVLAIAAIIATAGIQIHGWLIGYILALHWSFQDQRRRCPVCLERLAKPVSIGCCAHTLLEWRGTELVCTKGHGLLYASDTDNSFTPPRRWLSLDASWQDLFAVHHAPPKR